MWGALFHSKDDRFVPETQNVNLRIVRQPDVQAHVPPLILLERVFIIDNLLVRIHFIIEMIRWTGLAPWDFEFRFPVSLTSIVLGPFHTACQHYQVLSLTPPPPGGGVQALLDAKL